MNLVFDLAVILITAGICTFISKALKQPLILGYIVAGFLIGPKLGLIPGLISSTESINQWSEIGIIFLLFGLGLEFSFKKLVKVGSAAIITAGTNCICMFIIGMVTGSALGWSSMESIFLGGLMSMSSTTIIIKAYNDLGLKNEPYVALVFGTLVVEDLIAVLLMVLLSTLAVSNKFAGGEMLMGLAKLLIFIIICFVVGIYIIPTLFSKAKKYLTDEILLLASIGLCFGMVALASYFGFSSALGAFVMGSLLSETLEGERIAKMTTSMKDLFGAIFFVSVGMLVDPAVIGEHWLPILIITAATMVGILIFSTCGALLAGQGLDTAVHTGFTLAQLGEFSFIIAKLGCDLGVMREFIYPIIVAVSVITTFTTPYMIKAGAPASIWLKTHLPAGILAKLNPSQEKKKGESFSEIDQWKKFITSFILNIIIYGVIIFVLMLASTKFLRPAVDKYLPHLNQLIRSLICAGVTFFVMIPFIFGMSFKTPNKAKEAAKKLVTIRKSNKMHIIAIQLLRSILSIAIIFILVLEYFDAGIWSLLMAVVFIILSFLLTKSSFKRLDKLESHFLANLNEKERLEKEAAPVSTTVKDKLLGYDVQIFTFEISPNATYLGKSLRELPFRSKHDVNVIKIMRGNKSIIIPDGDEKVFPYDKLLIVGTNEQLEGFKKTMNTVTEEVPKQEQSDEFAVEHQTLDEESYLTGKTLRELRMRSYGCMLISVLRGDDFVTNPSADFVFKSGDTVWIAGLAHNCAKFS